jgi:UDP-N-acetylmuramyl pentapeptide phosphotransferase/UDP-N-acetylglucosamine-1-phosphate transferase
MSVAAALVVGVITVRCLRLGAEDMLRAPTLMRHNYRDRIVPTAGGVLIVLAVLVVEAGRAALGAMDIGRNGLTEARSLVLFAAFGFALLGLIDDLLAQGEDRGFRGHLRALREGRLTTGFLKLFGGAGIAVVLVASPGFATGRRLLVDALLIALAANLANLFDRAPGRVIKVAIVAYVPLAIALGPSDIGVAIALVMGAAFGLLGDDLYERLMLGDTGANVIGAVLGLGVVIGLSETARLTVLIVVAALNIAAELVSFGAVIDRVPPVRAVDHWGRRP